MYLLLFIFGLGASGQALVFALVKDNNEPARVGTAIGFNNMAVVLGGMLQPLVGFILIYAWDGVVEEGIPLYTVANYQLALLILPIAYFIALIVAVFCLRESNCQPQYER